jgi:oligopeptide transport system permease protein
MRKPFKIPVHIKTAFLRFVGNRLAFLGLIVLCVLTGLSLFAPLFSSYSYSAQDLAFGAQSPSFRHWFGTDTLGRDLFTRVLYGGRVSILVGIAATFVALCIGVTYGAIAGFSGKTIDRILMRFVDILYAFPFTIFVIILMVLFGRNIVLLFCAIGAVEWLTMARIVRSQVMGIKKLEYIDAAITLGLDTKTIIIRHVVPNVIGPVIVYATLTIPSVMLLEAFLSFLGLGVQSPMSSWGLLIKEGADVMEEYPWMLVFPGVMLSLALFSLNVVGDGLRDALDVASAKD